MYARWHIEFPDVNIVVFAFSIFIVVDQKAPPWRTSILGMTTVGSFMSQISGIYSESLPDGGIVAFAALLWHTFDRIRPHSSTRPF